MPTYEITSPDGRTFQVTAPDGATQDQVLAYAQQNYGQQKSQTPASMVANDAITKDAKNFAKDGSSDALGGLSQAVLNAGAGLVRGAGSIGATLAAPFDMASDALDGKGLSLASNRERRARIDENMAMAGAKPDSLLYAAGKLGGEVAGTAGVGSALAKPLVGASNLIARGGFGASPTLDAMALALQTGGFRTGGQLGRVADAATRIGAGAAVGGVSAGLVNPEDAGAGAVIGGVLPGAAQVAGKAGQAVRNSILGNATANPRTMETARQSIDAGYVIPPNMVNPNLKNQVIESISGKQATQQIASTRNTQVTEGLVREALGIPADVQLTQGTLENLRRTAGKAYADVASISPQASADLEALKVARNESQGWFKAYNRSASPDDLAKAKAARTLANDLELALEAHAKDAGAPELIPALRDARKAIAKTYTVGRALNDASGTVDARVFGRMHEKGLPLSDGLDIAGQFASAFPTIAKSPQQVGSPAAHNLKALASMGLGLGGNATMGPAGFATAALPFVAPPLARAQMFSRATQRGLLDAVITPQELGLLTQAAYRTAPLLASQ